MKLISSIFILLFLYSTNVHSDNNLDFQEWKKNFKKIALQSNISEETFDIVLSLIHI